MKPGAKWVPACGGGTACLRGRRRFRRAGAVLLAVMMAFATTLAAGAPPSRVITVFAAASLTDALADVGTAWEKASGNTVHFSFASSSTLARQIVEGAPADVYIAADEQWMDYIAQHDDIVAASRVDLVGNELALVAPRASPIGQVAIAPGFALARLLGDGRLAMGNPEHVPAGIYGKQALTALHVWKQVKDHVARAANVRAALALVALGDAPLGIVYRTDALASRKVKIVALFPTATHKPIVYPGALVKQAGHDDTAARAFLRFLRSDAAARVFARYGFKVLD